MNSKGQTLVVFILILPIIFIIFSLIVDLGLLYIDKRSVENNTYDAVSYYLKSVDTNKEEKVKKVLNNNLKNIKVSIDDNTDYVEITVLKTRKTLFSKILKQNEIKVTYKGLKNSNKIVKG